MNKILFRNLSVFFCLVICPLLADCSSKIEIRAAEFYHTSGRFREIYGKFGGSYQIEASTLIYNCIEGWTNFDWLSKDGRSVGFKDPTRVSIANISLGVKFPYELCDQLTFYAGIGPSLSRIWIKNKSRFTHEKITKLVVGGVLKTGINYYINDDLFIDFFIDYLYQSVHFETTVDIGGIKMGIGIGTNF